MSETTIGRRAFLKRLIGVTAACAGTASLLNEDALAASHFKKGKRRPNVILILSDDQGTVDANCYGADDLYTPNIDALARRGVRFTQFYVPAAVCTPSRGALLTGRYPLRNGAGDNFKSLKSNEITIADVFKQAGYRTGIFGKWHVGDAIDQGPLSKGFDEFVGFRGGCFDNYTHSGYDFEGKLVCGCNDGGSGPNANGHDLWRGKERLHEEGTFFPDIMVRETNRFIEENKDKPFFVYVPFNVPHYPEQGSEEWKHIYKTKGMTMPRLSYAAFLSTMDDKIGQILDKVRQLNLTEDTLVIFQSDHGYSTEARANGGGGSSGIFRGNKFEVWEGGIRVPCIVSLPGVIPENQTRDQVATSMDWLSTCAAICDIKLPGLSLDGKNILPILKSSKAPTPHKILHWQWKNKTTKKWAVREGDWKLVSQNGLFLSNMAVDPSETKNLASKHPKKVSHLSNLHTQWLASL
ncbi:MAG: sulfatase-like hydrolase/transferase [Planctomycetes bacterium]|nr:sulfatase-like hydrolase/transferase [Planctomycetota bacterium]